MNEQEWIALWRYGLGQDPPHPLNPSSGEEIPGVWQEAVDGISHMAYIHDRSWNLLAHNSAFAALFPDGRAPHNTMRWMALDRTARSVLTDWENAWAPFALPHLRGALAADPHDETLKQIEKEVLADPVSSPLYDRVAPTSTSTATNAPSTTWPSAPAGSPCARPSRWPPPAPG